MRKNEKGQFVCEPIEDRLWAKIAIGEPDACWPWQGNTNTHGYGTIVDGRALSGTSLAHRVTYEVKNGPIPGGLVIRHSCDNPPCCNPRHLVTGTQAQNVEDAVLRNRGLGRKSTLSEEQIARVKVDPRSQRVIALDYGLNQSTVSRIKASKEKSLA